MRGSRPGAFALILLIVVLALVAVVAFAQRPPGAPSRTCTWELVAGEWLESCR